MGTLRAAAVGHRIAQLREAAGLKQADLARQITWSQAVLSRVEAGERALQPDELRELLGRIGTREALALNEIVARDWTYLPTPPLDHGDQDLFWAAEQITAELLKLADTQDVRPAFLKRVDADVAEIRLAVGHLLRREHTVAFIGAIGIGKSTAICKATGLEIMSDEGQKSPVLETGGGGITLCEVSLKVGPGYGVIVTPRSNEEVRADVADFAELLLARSTGRATSDDGEDGQRAVPRELERAIRNLSGLRPTRVRGEDGKPIRTDPAKGLADQLGSARDLTVEILSRMDLPRRDRRESWFDPTFSKGPHEWLKEMYEQINNGRHSDFSLPAHIDLVVPTLIGAGHLTLAVVDTRGIDRVAARADLEVHLLDSHTVCILCSGFNDAPSQPVQHLLDRAREIDNPFVDTHSGVLVLARPGEALAVKDEAGIRAESDEDGYELKGEQIAAALTPAGLQDLPTEFFNSFGDDPTRLQAFVVNRVEQTREHFRDGLKLILENAGDLLANVEREQVLEEQRETSRVVSIWLDDHAVPPPSSSHVHDTLMTEIRRAHASTLNAAVRREGEWDALSYSYQLGFGSRRVAVGSLGDWLSEFKGLAETLQRTHPLAIELLGQALRLMEQAYDDLLKKMQVAGAALYRRELQTAQTLWEELASEWGTGTGYKSRVAQRQNAWFGEDQQTRVEQEILGVLGREWQSLRHRVSAIFDVE